MINSFGGIKIKKILLIGQKCNNKCNLCRFLEKSSKEKKIEEIEQELQKINKDIYDEIILSGGEVLLRKDIFDIIKLVLAYGFKPGIETNARVLAFEPLIKELKKFKISTYYVDFYSHRPEIQNYLTNSRDSYIETIRGIKNLVDNKMNVLIKLIITRMNFLELDRTIEFLHKEGIKQIQLFYPESAPEDYKRLEEEVPSIEEAFVHINKALAKMDELKIRKIPRFTPFSMIHYESKRIKKNGNDFSYKEIYDNTLHTKKPEITVVIPTYNRSRILKNTLVSLFNQTLQKERFEVIVIDDGSDDDTEDMIKNLKPPYRLRYFRQKHLGYGPGRARNLGVVHANGDIILFLDSDVISDPKNLEEHLKTHNLYKKRFNHDILVIGKRLDMHFNSAINRILNPKNILNNFDIIRRIPARPDIREDFFRWCNDEPSNFKAPYVMIYTNNISVKRKYLLDAGLIDESFVFWSVEDQELGYRLQWLRFVLNSDAKGYHQHHPLVYSSKEGMLKAIKYNSRIFYKKYLDPKIYEMYKPFINYNREFIQINRDTVNDSPFFKWLGKKPEENKIIEQIKQEIELSKGEGINEVIFEGGNPLLHPDIFEILNFARKQDFKVVGIDTEADSLDNIKTILDLLKNGVNEFIINVCGSNEKEHDYLVNKKGSFKKTIRAILNLTYLNQEFWIRIIISKKNYVHLKEMIDLINGLGCNNVIFELPLSSETNELLFDETTLPLSGLLYYYIYEAMKHAKGLGMKIRTDNIFSEFLGLTTGIIIRMYNLFNKPLSIGRFDLR